MENSDRTSRQEFRLVLAFFAVPVGLALLSFGGFLTMWYMGALASTPIDPTDAALSWATGVGIIAICVTVLGAAPVVAWLRRRRALSWRSVFITAIVLGNTPFALVVLGILATHSFTLQAAREWDGLRGAARATALGTGYGLVAAILFGLLAGLRTRARRAD